MRSQIDEHKNRHVQVPMLYASAAAGKWPYRGLCSRRRTRKTHKYSPVCAYEDIYVRRAFVRAKVPCWHDDFEFSGDHSYRDGQKDSDLRSPKNSRFSHAITHKYSIAFPPNLRSVRFHDENLFTRAKSCGTTPRSILRATSELSRRDKFSTSSFAKWISTEWK